MTTFGFEVIEPGEAENRGDPASVGVGGVLTITGAAFSPVGGVLGRPFGSIIYGDLELLGRSGDSWSSAAWGVCLSGKICPILAATLPRLLIVSRVSFSCRAAGDAWAFRSILGFGLVDRREMNASLSLPTGDVGAFNDTSPGACREAVVKVGGNAEGETGGDADGDAEALPADRKSWDRAEDLMRGEEVVK